MTSSKRANMARAGDMPAGSDQAPKTGPAPVVSIGVPVFNGERSLRAALDSLLAQTFTDFELIVSDNASTDGTQSICREYAERDLRIRYIRQASNAGAGANFRLLIREAIGEYFMWAAADDLRAPDCLEFFLAHIGSAGGVFSTYAVHDAIALSATEVAPPPLSGQPRNKADVLRILQRPCPSMIYGLFRREVALAAFSDRDFDWQDLHFVVKVSMVAGMSTFVAAPRYFVGIEGGYTLKPVNGRFFNPLPFIYHTFPVVRIAGMRAILLMLRAIATAVRLNAHIALFGKRIQLNH